MTPLPRLLVIMGSGETSPTMSKVHREVFDRLEESRDGPVPAVVLDTPFGFQENADDIAGRAVAYFRESVRRPVGVASFRRAEAAAGVEGQTSLARIRDAAWVFAGPGSPSYAARQWRAGPIPGLLADKLATGGCVVFASAAAATLGRLAVPVYEIYKVGQDPHWIEGLDLLASLRMRAVVIPHFNNAEGGNHDTRFCYLGERRLATLEAALAPDELILGLDEHTAGVFDLDAGELAVRGLGALTVRHAGCSVRLVAGRTIAIDELPRLVTGGPRPPAAAAAAAPAATARPDDRAGNQPLALAEAVAGVEDRFAKTLRALDAPSAAACIIELDQLVVDWSRDTMESDQLDRARIALRSMVVRLADAAAAGMRDPREPVAPFVNALLAARRRAREAGRYDDADRLRDELVAAGVEVRDTLDGTQWELR